MKTSVTELQAKMLRKIALDDYTPLNGAEPESHEDTSTWAEMIIESPQDKGVFTSLMNAGLVWRAEDGKDSTVGLTEAGFEAYKNLG